MSFFGWEMIFYDENTCEYRSKRIWREHLFWARTEAVKSDISIEKSSTNFFQRAYREEKVET